MLLALTSPRLYSQSTERTKIVISGIIADSVSRNGLEYPTVALFDDSLKLIKAAAGGVDGKFLIEAPSAGKFIFSAGTMGYSTHKQELVLDGVNKRIDIGTIYLTEGVQLAEVTVTGVLPLIKNEADKLTYNLESDPETPSSALADILRKVPMVSVDGEGTVRLNGETNFKVLVNGRSSGMLVKNFKDAIRAMPASSIKSIEVITNPPAKYDAEGIGGIINIITHKKQAQGYSGSVNIGANTLGSFNTGGYISVQSGKLSISTNIYTGRNVTNKTTMFSQSENFISEQFRYSITDGEYNAGQTFSNGGIEASYEIDSLNLITLSGWGYMGSQSSTGSNLFISRNTLDQITRKYTNTSDTKYGYGSLSGSVAYQKTFKKPDQNFTLSYSIDASPMNIDIQNTIDPEVNYIPYSQHSINEAMGTEHTFQADYYDPLTKKHMIETGVKYILRQNKSETEVKQLDPQSGIWIDNPQKVNDLDYDQHIASLYGGYVFKHNSLTLKGGFRSEYTVNDGLSKSYEGNIPFTNKQFDIVPYVNFTYMLKKANIITAGYTQRLSRPGIWHLNPYVNDFDPMNISYGNPNLETVKRNSVTLGYRKSSLKWNLGLNLACNFTQNNIEEIRRINPLGVRYTTYENIGKNSSYRLGINYSYRSGQKFSVNVNGQVAYTTVSSDEFELKNDGFSFNGGVSGNAALWEKASFNFNFYLFGGDVSLQSQNPVLYFTSFSISQRFLKDNLTFSINVREPFDKYKVFKYDSRDNTYSMHNRYSMLQRSAGFSLFWRFGKYDVRVKKARRSIVDDKLGGSNPAAPASVAP